MGLATLLLALSIAPGAAAVLPDEPPLLRGAEYAVTGDPSLGAARKSERADNDKGQRSTTGATNVYGKPLAPCSRPGMAKTGFDRSGQCVDQEGDTGSHHICIDLRSASSNNKDFCQVTGQDDWCKESMPCHQNDAKECPVERWCVCQWAFAGYLQKAGGCEAVQEIECEAVNAKAVEAYEEGGEKYAEALECLKERCKLGEWGGGLDQTAVY